MHHLPGPTLFSLTLFSKSDDPVIHRRTFIWPVADTVAYFLIGAPPVYFSCAALCGDSTH